LQHVYGVSGPDEGDGKARVRELAALLQFPPGQPDGQSVAWGEAVRELVRRTGWTLPHVANLSIGQFASSF
jgi:hypothetical protein